MDRQVLKATFLQFSGILGAGIFILPHLYAPANPFQAYPLLIILTLIVALANILYIDVILATKGDHQLSGYAQIHLGPKFKNLATANLILLAIGVVSAYIKIASGFISLLLPASTNLSALIFIALLLLFHLSKLNPSHRLSQIFPLISLFIVFLLFVLSFNFTPVSLPPAPLSPLIFGSTIFALSGFTIIPEVEELLRGSGNIKAKLKFSSLAGLFLVVFVYLIYIFAVSRISGPNLSPDSVTGLFLTSNFLGRLLSFFGAVTLLKASLNFLFIQKELFFRDLNLSQGKSYLLSSLLPLFTLVFANTSFVNLISLTGSVTVFISVLIICLIRLRLKPSPAIRFSVFLILSVLFIGLVSEIL